jgi:hypothetical protein
MGSPAVTKDVNVYSPTWSLFDSYGIIARNTHEQLRVQGLNVGIRGYMADERDSKCDDFILHSPVPGDGGILLGYPINFREFPPEAILRGKKVAISMFESTSIPFGWASWLNACDKVIVPSKWVKEVFEQGGVKTPIECISLGIDPAYTFAERSLNGKIKYLALCDRGSRKNWQQAIFSFVGAFGDSPDVELTLKCRADSPLSWMTPANSNIKVIAADYTPEQMHQMFCEHHVLICPARGEGFGWFPREFVATGGISIATDFSGLSDHIDSWGIPIRDYSLEVAWQGTEMEGTGLWANPVLDSLRDLVLDTHNNLQTLFASAQERSDFVHQTYNWGTFGAALAAQWL